MDSPHQTAAIILAAGKSTRMDSDKPKVLHELCGQPMLAYALQECRLAGVDRLIVVVGYKAREVQEAFASEPDIEWVVQTQQKGTGHAVMCCRNVLDGFDGSVLVIAGDMPLIRRDTLSSLLEARWRDECAITLATTVLDDPSGYGRIIRDDAGDLEGIVEDRDCTTEQKEIHEVNPSFYCFDASAMFQALESATPDNAKGEYYVTDAVHLLRSSGRRVSAIEALAPEDAMGINSRLDLAVVARSMQDRIQTTHLKEGVTIVDPDTTWIECGAAIGRETMVYPFTFVGAGAQIGSGCRIGPHGHVARGETVSDGASVGPSICVEANA